MVDLTQDEISLIVTCLNKTAVPVQNAPYVINIINKLNSSLKTSTSYKEKIVTKEIADTG